MAEPTDRYLQGLEDADSVFQTKQSLDDIRGVEQSDPWYYRGLMDRYSELLREQSTDLVNC
jgi:hypothetical protein